MAPKSSRIGVTNSTTRRSLRKDDNLMGDRSSADEGAEDSSLTKNIPEAGFIGINSRLCSDFSFLWICPERMQALNSSIVSWAKNRRLLNLSLSCYKKSARVTNFSLLLLRSFMISCMFIKKQSYSPNSCPHAPLRQLSTAYYHCARNSIALSPSRTSSASMVYILARMVSTSKSSSSILSLKADCRH